MTGDLDPFKIFLELQLGLPRNGPGSAASTARAFAMLPGLREDARILDIGCGQGASTFELLRLTRGHVTAVDLFEPFLDKLAARAERARIGEDRLTIKRGDMAALPFHDGEFDLVWSEGAIYLVGFETGLRLWRRLVKPGGFVAVTECTWLTDAPAAEAMAFWNDAYPGMGTVAENGAAAERAGYEIIGTFTLPQEDWWAEYYTSMRVRIAEMRATYGAAAESVLAAEEAEIALIENNPGQYSYVFYVMRRGD
ncbi:class I SAM-dependent methyltransferase [Parvibaculum sp.]|uniref:class I SAM-dependent methyltransferase n=1 Tax=Parvibaculum sp. TaxID=2024848 RepID=UPI00349FD1C6